MLRWLVVFLLFFSAPLYACNIYDDRGNVIHLPNDAQRIISLAPDATEILFSIGAGNQIVGVISGSDYPDPARNIQTVGSSSGLDVERIISLHPDLIINWNGNFARQIAVIKRFGIPVYENNPVQLQDVATAMKKFGCLTGKQNEANKQAGIYENLLSALRREYHHDKPVRAFYQLGDHGLMTVNKNSWINQAIELCGGRNIFADAKTASPEVSIEAVMAANPQVILAGAANESWKEAWQEYGNIDAVKYQRLVTIHPDLIDRAGPRLLQGIQAICVGIARS